MENSLKRYVGGFSVWNNEYRERRIPGTTRVPLQELLEFFQGLMDGRTILDAGSGSGRSTEELQRAFPKSKVTALDLSHAGLRATPCQNRIQASVENLPFMPQSFDAISVCGVMTNIVDEDPKKAQQSRSQIMMELSRVVKPGGCVIVSDFDAEHDLTHYPVDYRRHALITGELGTIAVLKSGKTFQGMIDEEVAAMKGTDAIERYAHHYSPHELMELLQKAGLSVLKYTVEIAHTPIGNKPIENIIMVGAKR